MSRTPTASDQKPPESKAVERPRLVLALPDGIEMAFRGIPAGEFIMGSRDAEGFDREQPLHRVIVEERFWIAETPVTQAQYAAVIGSLSETTLSPYPSFFTGANRPVEKVSFDDAGSWCVLLAELLPRLEKRGLPKRCPGPTTCRLPCEAEWEYACRTGSRTEYGLGDGAAVLSEMGWFGDELDEGSTQDVAMKHPNDWGLFDMHGNVLEWCADVWDARAYRKRANGWRSRVWTVEDAGSDAEYTTIAERHAGRPLRVLRGGSWDYPAGWCRSAYRNGRRPTERWMYQGFRVCLLPGSRSARPRTTARLPPERV